MINDVSCALLTAQLLSQGQPAAPAAQAPQIETKKVEGTDNVYTFRNQNGQAMFIVTSEGVIATDPVGCGRPQGGALPSLRSGRLRTSRSGMSSTATITSTTSRAGARSKLAHGS